MSDLLSMLDPIGRWWHQHVLRHTITARVYRPRWTLVPWWSCSCGKAWVR